MTRVYVYHAVLDRVELFYRENCEKMPYVVGHTLTVKAFKSNSDADRIWTDTRALHAWNTLRTAWGEPIYVGSCFCRPGDRKHGPQSQHYAGVAFDIGQNLDAARRKELRQTAERHGLWSYIAPEYLTPGWVHLDAGIAPEGLLTKSLLYEGVQGYPELLCGSRGVYVFVLQDILYTLGLLQTAPDGLFGNQTAYAVRQYQLMNGHTADGKVQSALWASLFQCVYT